MTYWLIHVKIVVQLLSRRSINFSAPEGEAAQGTGVDVHAVTEPVCHFHMRFATILERTCLAQAVPITPGCILGGALQPATFECSELHGALFASGGTQPTIIQQWDMHREQLSQHVRPPQCCCCCCCRHAA